MSTEESSIEIFENASFQGKKHVFTQKETDVRSLDLNTNRISIKVKGQESWKLWSRRNQEGENFVLTPGNYETLCQIPRVRKVAIVSSVQPLSRSLDPDHDKYPRGDAYERQWAALSAWFLGTKAENMDLFTDLATTALRGHEEFRRDYFPTDPSYLTREILSTPEYSKEVQQLRKKLNEMCEDLKNSVPTFSTRFQGHMNWDVTMPANLGYIAALLYNANNVANEASPVTTRMEIEVGQQICEMLGYGIPGYPTPWGHITADGTIANIEALWSSRNVKFYPLTVQKALLDDQKLPEEQQKLKQAHNYKITTAAGKSKKLTCASQWELLNLEVDQIVAMPKNISYDCHLDPDDYSAIVDKYNLANLGWHDFMTLFNLKDQAVVLAPMSKHYSWPKAANLLGIGQHNLIGVDFDENARMSVTALRVHLERLLKKETPIISVVCVMGTTEESAVDPLDEVLNIRDEYRRKGLNFAINCDGAWGGYFCSMLHKPSTTNRQTWMIPDFPLSEYTKKQLIRIKDADSCTVDPHKSGFAPYPAGGLCYRNEAMKGFDQVNAEVVYHSGEDPSIGTWGIEGSKPGAAAAGVLLGHRVIGLDTYGFGQILGQCTFGAKLFYCMWLTLARDKDPFVCVPMKPLENLELKKAKEFISKKIYGRTNKQLFESSEVMEFLTKIGPDTLINAFAVNTTGNTDLEICNAINYDIFERTSHSNDIYNVHRVPLILTQSKLPHMIFGKAVKQFKRRLGLPENTDGDLQFLINTVMNPWTTANKGIEEVGRVFRQITLNAIGHVTDTPDLHGFVATGRMSESGKVFGDHLPMFNVKAHQYHAIAKFQFQNQCDINTFRDIQYSTAEPVIFGNVTKSTLGKLLRDGRTNEFKMDVYLGMPKDDNSNRIIKDAAVLVDDIPLFKHFDDTVESYPDEMSYFLYGDENGTYISHNMTKLPDFQQIVRIDHILDGVTPELLEQGINITIPCMSGDPVTIDGKIIDPLNGTKYAIECPGYNGIPFRTTMYIGKPEAKIFFDSVMINQ